MVTASSLYKGSSLKLKPTPGPFLISVELKLELGFGGISGLLRMRGDRRVGRPSLFWKGRELFDVPEAAFDEKSKVGHFGRATTPPDWYRAHRPPFENSTD